MMNLIIKIQELFKNIKIWLEGHFTCISCGRRVFLYSFGYGKTICPDCYRGQNELIYLNDNFFLNRIMNKKKGLYVPFKSRQQRLHDTYVSQESTRRVQLIEKVG